jgi:hypothetical protein
MRTRYDSVLALARTDISFCEAWIRLVSQAHAYVACLVEYEMALSLQAHMANSRDAARHYAHEALIVGYQSAGRLWSEGDRGNFPFYVEYDPADRRRVAAFSIDLTCLMARSAAAL